MISCTVIFPVTIILNPCQSGFRSNQSTNTTLIDVSDHILNNTNNGKVTGAIFLDLRKAFNTVSHKLLLKKNFILMVL